MATQRDLALAYSPGVAAACEAIVADPDSARDYTARGNLVAVISNGTAVLGLGNIGALAGKPVMEGKAVLFKKFAGIDVFDIEVDAADPDRFCDVVAALEPTFGAINLEDIKAPECFAIEAEAARADAASRCSTTTSTAPPSPSPPRSATACCCRARQLEEVRLVTSGAGAAALACVDLLVAMGLRRRERHADRHQGRGPRRPRRDWLPNMARYAKATDGAHAGRSAGRRRRVPRPVRAARAEAGMAGQAGADKPLILALANPDPEILPEAVRAARPDAIIATGRSDYPNQVNNVLCFPFIFRGALDVRRDARSTRR